MITLLASCSPPLPVGKARLPYGNAITIQAEEQLEETETELGEAQLQEGVFWLQDIIFFKGEGLGAKIAIPFDVPEDGRYEILPLVLSSYDYGIYEAYFEDRRVGPRMNLYKPYVAMPRGYPLGRFELKKGRHTIRFECVGKDGASGGHYFGIDQIVLSKVNKVRLSKENSLETSNLTAPHGIVRQALRSRSNR